MCFVLCFQKGIPCLIMLDKSNSIITKEGRMEVNEDPDGEVRKIENLSFVKYSY